MSRLCLLLVCFMVKVLAVFGETVVNNEVTGGGNQGTPTPIVLYHGMGDTCCASGSIGAIKKFLEKNIEGVYVHSLKIGNSSKDEFANSYFMDSNEQIELACHMIRKDDYLQGGYHAIGFSQGGQFVRAIAQRCPNPPIKNLVTFGAQHQGVYGLPRCSGEKDTLCNLARELLHFGAYTDYVQKRVVQAQYWHDPRKEEVYKAKSLFLADINNERLPRNQTYVENLNKLENFVMIKFVDDTIVDPPETESFGFFVPGQGKVIQTMKETDLYKEDYIGLRKLDEAGRVKIYDVPGNHLQINMTWFATELIPKYLQ